MIFVILGTQDKSFTRLLDEIDNLIKNNVITEKVIVQAGSTKYKSDNMEIYDLLPMKQFGEYVKKSNYIITHGGVGSILDGLKNNKKVIAVPRLKEYDEHENNHQLQIVSEFYQKGYILKCDNIKNLDKVILDINRFEPNRYESNNQKFINKIEEYIDNL